MNHPRLMLTFAILFTLSAYIYQVIPFCLTHAQVCFESAENAPIKPTAPTAYRPLPGWLLGAAGYSHTKAGVIGSALIVHFAMIPAVFIAFYQWMKRWTKWIVPAILLLTVTISAAFQFYLFDPAVMVETLLVLLLLLFHDRFWVCTPIVLIASLNRETAVFLPFIWWALNTNRFRRAVLLLLVFATVFVAIRVIVGPVEHVLGNVITGTLAYNMGTFSDALVVNLVLLPIWITAALNYRRTSKELHYFAWIALAYGIAIIVGAAWDEAARLVLPITPLIFPMIFQEQTT